MLFGFGDDIRDSLWGEGNYYVNNESTAYDIGGWTPMVLGGARLTYSGVAKGISLVPNITAKQAFNARNMLKKVFRLNPWSKFRIYSYEQFKRATRKSDLDIIKSSGKTNRQINTIGTWGFTGGLVDEE